MISTKASMAIVALAACICSCERQVNREAEAKTLAQVDSEIKALSNTWRQLNGAPPNNQSPGFLRFSILDKKTSPSMSGATVHMKVKNDSREFIKRWEVRVFAYDHSGKLLGTGMTSGGNLPANESKLHFPVISGVDHRRIGSYKITMSGVSDVNYAPIYGVSCVIDEVSSNATRTTF